MRSIFKQSSYVFLAQALTRLISFFYVIYLARTLGVEDFGLYTVALAYFSIISAIADFGFNRFLVREIARSHLKAQELLSNIVVLRLTLTSVLFAVFAVFLYIFDSDRLRVNLILLATLAVLPQVAALTFDGVFVAFRRLQFSALALFLSGFTTAVIGLFLVSLGLGPLGAVIALILGQLFYAVLLLGLLIKNQGWFLSEIKFSIIKEALAGSLPYGLLGVLGLLYFRIDAILLSYIKGSFEAGIYGTAYKFLEAVTVIPSAFSVALFPVLVKVHESSPQDVKKIYFKSFKIMLGIGLLVVAGYFLVLPEVIKILLPSYLPSILAIQILSLSIPFMFIHVPAVAVLLSTDKYLKTVLILSVVTLIFNVMANLLFIPQFGFMAASWITVLSEVLSFIIFFLLIKIKILDK